MTTSVVAVKSAFLSKINWAQAIGFLAMILSTFGIDLDDKTRADLLAGIIGLQGAITWILRTWFTTTVTPSVAGK